MRGRSLREVDGILLLNKPKGPTSSFCVEKIKKHFKQRKVGHAGTLDPIASGLLIVLVGQGTKLASYIMEGRKTYRGIVELGRETTTYDATGEEVGRKEVGDIDPLTIIQGIEEWQTYTEQEIPPYSAAKYKGKPFYFLSRKGETPPKKIKKICIDHSEVLNIDLPFVEFRVRCSKGTYIRSLAHSLGKRIGVGAILKELIREEIGPFSLVDAIGFEELFQREELFWEGVIPLENSLPHWRKIMVDMSIVRKVRNGVRPRVRDIPGLEVTFPGERYLFLDPEGRALALMETKQREEEFFFSILRGLWKGGVV